MRYSAFGKNIFNNILWWYIISLITTGILFSVSALKPYLYIMGVASVALFALGAPKYFLRWSKLSEKKFAHNLFVLAFIIRLVYVIFIYNFNLSHYGTFYESSIGDIGFYHGVALEFANMTGRESSFFKILESWNVGVDDRGYILYLTALFIATGATKTASSVIVALIMKSVFGALTCVFSYRIALKHFGKDVGRMAGLFCALNFSMIWWCGSMMKETEMVFCTMAALYYADKVLLSASFRWMDFIMAVLMIASTFFFRTVLGIVLVLSLCTAVFCMKGLEIGRGKKIALITLSVLMFSLSIGNMLIETSKDLIQQATGTDQETNMEWRGTREGGNSLAKYAGAAVFAPMIFTIPFPTMVYTQEGQEMQMQVNGGNYLKNVLSFFVIISIVILIVSGKWRSHSLLLAFICGYVMALAFSKFAQSGRFHMPIMPVFMMFAAYGMTLLDKKKMKWFKMVLPLELIICIAWSWYKLAGRGLI